jgi:site-specific recombinase XerD
MLHKVEDALEDHLEQLNTPTQLLFPGRNFKGLSRKQVWKLMRKYGELAGIPKEKQHPHSCRHFAGVNALEAGLPIEQVQALLGHKAITSTMVYANVTASLRQEAADKLNAYN